ncbi:GyrI-like domain-containing protein [Parapedobacter tibetensis]|uniref:GyrI-like domain-containing protein n=1 Tax=Parapedobacter tibetensis TaxID=2972951 RepID=UPI00214DACC7|nr:effector binding domain-containing protein [Parapedobacter tibetensis]
MEYIEQFYVIGIAVKTSNQREQAAQDIPALWQRFIVENCSARIPNKVDDTVYCSYLDYEKDHMAPYTTLIGCRVTSLDTIPGGMVGETLGGGSYAKFTATGNITEGIVYDEWLKIWSAGLARRFTTDFEVYSPKVRQQESAEIDIFVAIEP